MCKHHTARLEALERRSLLSAGLLDRYFGDNGLVRMQYPLGNIRAISDMITQRDGKIVAAVTTFVSSSGHPDTLADTLARFNRNGSLDATFGNGVGAINLNVPA